MTETAEIVFTDPEPFWTVAHRIEDATRHVVPAVRFTGADSNGYGTSRDLLTRNLPRWFSTVQLFDGTVTVAADITGDCPPGPDGLHPADDRYRLTVTVEHGARSLARQVIDRAADQPERPTEQRDIAEVIDAIAKATA